MTSSKSLEELLAEAKRLVDAMTPEELETMMKAQRESWVRAEMSWPKPNFTYINGVKTYASYKDYLND